MGSPHEEYNGDDIDLQSPKQDQYYRGSPKDFDKKRPQTLLPKALRYDKLKAFCREHNDLTDYEPFFARWTDEEMCNTAICLCHIVDRAMTSFLEKRDREFVAEGGIRERMTAARLDMRGNQKQLIVQLEAENAQLRARVASLERELAMAKSSKPQ